MRSGTPCDRARHAIGCDMRPGAACNRVRHATGCGMRQPPEGGIRSRAACDREGQAPKSRPASACALPPGRFPFFRDRMLRFPRAWAECAPCRYAPLVCGRRASSAVALRSSFRCAAFRLQRKAHPSRARYASLFVVRCSLFVVRCSLFVVRCSLFVVRTRPVPHSGKETL